MFLVKAAKLRICLVRLADESAPIIHKKENPGSVKKTKPGNGFLRNRTNLCKMVILQQLQA